MDKELSYKKSTEPDYVLVHKRALIAQSHCVGLALKCYSVCSGSDIQDITKQLSFYANSHVNELTVEQVNLVVEQLIERQGESGIIELKDLVSE